MAQFKKGDLVCVSSFIGINMVGQVISDHNDSVFDIEFVEPSQTRRWWHQREDIRHATPQEIAHHFAEEICRGA
jgi:hypothetical protein